MKTKEPFWEKTYQDFEAPNDFGPPSPEVLDLAKRLPLKAKVLDLGCGEGRHTFILAELGLDVTGIDISPQAIRKLQFLATQRNLSIKTLVKDMRTFVFDDLYDLIIAHGTLFLIEREYWEPLLKQIQAHTKINGYNIIAVFTDSMIPPDDIRDLVIGPFKEDELFDLYQGWRILLQKVYLKSETHPNNKMHHVHPVNKIVAQKITP
jgi:tellurite methyltransferase